ncbi:hypothetical protein BN1723_011498, partial [Verticillium longisporum]
MVSLSYFKKLGGLGSLVVLLAASAAAKDMAVVDVVDDTACIEKLLDNHDWEAENSTLACGSTFSLVEGPAIVARQAHGTCQAQTYTYREHRVVASGTWWGPWIKSSGCLYCELSSGECIKEFNWGRTQSTSFSIGFGMDSVPEVKRAINAAPNLNFGYSWSESKSIGGATRCTVPARSKGSYWTQMLMGWSDSQSRTVRKKITKLCTATFEYDGWGGSGHADWPITNGHTVNEGCSTGAAAECP